MRFSKAISSIIAIGGLAAASCSPLSLRSASAVDLSSTIDTAFDFDYISFTYPNPLHNIDNNTVFTGITGQSVADTNGDEVYISGFSTSSDADTVGFLYAGDVSGEGTFTTLKVPDTAFFNSTITASQYFAPYVPSTSTSGSSVVYMCGSYRTSETGSKYDFGFLFRGFSNGTGIYSTIDPSPLLSSGDTVINTYPRGISGSLVVGFYTTSNKPNFNSAFVYDYTTDSYYSILFPSSEGISARGIWQMPSGTNYIVVGAVTQTTGVSGFVAHWDNVLHEPFNIQLYTRSSDVKQTHFYDVYPVSATNDDPSAADAFYIAADWVIINETRTVGLSVFTIANISNTNSDVQWTDFGYPNANNLTASGLFLNYITGSFQYLAGQTQGSPGTNYGSVTTFSLSSSNDDSSSSSSLSRSAVIAIAVCACVAFVIIVAFLIYRCRAAARAKAREAKTEMTGSDGNPMVGASMFSFKTIN